jgi:hypothetical protein
MAKIALLIGVSDYQGDLASLPGTQTDIQEMQRVLQKPQVGGFDVVELLSNPDPTQMQLAIEKLFQENRSRDDLILLYFSGHGVKDDNGTLHFATRITQKNQQGRIFTSTVVPANFIQNCMSNSRSKRQVLILDCCFSGAFANDMKAKQAEEVVDIKAQLGGEGRAVLTSSTATQVSYEKEGAGIYTRYLVQGLETGAADRNGDGHISVDELHEYAKEKVQEAAPSMQPEIYAVKEGYKILLAQAPQGDAKLTYRKELDARAKQKKGKLSPVDQRALRYRWQELGLSATEAEQIAQEVLQPYEVFWKKLQEFEQALQETLDYDPQMSTVSVDDLRYLQQVLKLRDEDVTPIFDAKGISFNLSTPTTSTPNKSSTSLEVAATPLHQQTTTPTPHQQLIDHINSRHEKLTELEEVALSPVNTKPLPPSLGLRLPSSWIVSPLANMEPLLPQRMEQLKGLSSKKGIDYAKLRDLLKAGNWQEADKETYRVMLRAVGKEEGQWFTSEELLNFPCTDLKTLDRLWVKYSNGKFGLSVQKQIYLECGGNPDGNYPGDKIWYEFCDRLGWGGNNESLRALGWKSETKVLPGYLPVRMHSSLNSLVLFSRIENCKV